MCNPPNPAARKTSFQGTDQAGGENIATAPSIKKQTPITGTIGTENAPPVTTPVPYSISHTPGIAVAAPALHSTMVSAAPTISGGAKLNRNLRAGADHIGSPAFDAFRHMARIPMAIASAPSSIQVTTHRPVDFCCAATRLAASAVTPMATPPQPGTAVKDPARSI